MEVRLTVGSGDASVHGEVDSCDEGCISAGQEGDRRGNVGWNGGSPEGHALTQFGHHLLVSLKTGAHRRQRDCGAHRIDADAVPSEIQMSS